MMLCMKSEQLNYVHDCDSAKDAWTKLENTYEPSGPIPGYIKNMLDCVSTSLQLEDGDI